MGKNKNTQKQNELRARGIEVIFNGHIDYELIIKSYQTLKFGLYGLFVKWHNGPDGNTFHTHCAVGLRDKPSIPWESRKEFFRVGQVRPELVQPIGNKASSVQTGNNMSLKKKMITYCKYLTNGHDNGTFEDSWNYKFDYELMSCKTVLGRALLKMIRGITFECLVKSAPWDEKPKLLKCKKQVLENFREYKEIINPPKPKVLRPWQKTVVDKLYNQSDRKLLWVVGGGNDGKTILHKELYFHHNAFVATNAKTSSLALAYEGQPIVSLNLGKNVNPYDINYLGFEDLKDGALFSEKYDSKAKIYKDSPAFVVFSNQYPNSDAMSLDRWDIFVIPSQK